MTDSSSSVASWVVLEFGEDEGFVDGVALAQGGVASVGGLGFQGGFHGGPGPAGFLRDRGGGDADQGELVVGLGLVRFGQLGALDVLHHLRHDPLGLFRGTDDHHRDQRAFGFDGGPGAALAHQDMHGPVVLAVGDDRFHHAVFPDAVHEVAGQGGVPADVDIHGEGCRVEHFQYGRCGCCVHGFGVLCRGSGGWGGSW
jgi:hypothetical protein